MDSPGWRKALEDIEAGRLGIARDRLESLIVSFPDELHIREKLGEVYFKLGYPIEAGRYWALVEDPTPEQEEAIKRFMATVAYRKEVMAKKLRLRSMSPELAERQMSKLDLQTENWINPSKLSIEDKYYERKRKLEQRGCILITVLILGLAFIGMLASLSVILGWQLF